jgi:hypothetical protein
MICIIIPNYNGVEHLTECLRSIYNQTLQDFSSIIVDNNSTDISVSYVKTNYPATKVIELDDNYGFAKAVNIGIKYALKNYDPDYIVLLNNDVECDKNFLDELLKGFISEEIGSVSPKMLNYFHRNIIDGAGDIASKRKLPFPRGRDEKDIGQYELSGYIFGACAGAVMYKSAVFKTTGYFDEDFFAFLEDVDFSFRLQYLGYKCYYNPKAVCYHKRGATISSNRSFHAFLLERNIITLRVKNYPFSVLILFSIYYQLERLYRFLKYFYHSPFYFLSALKGYSCGLFLIPKSFFKRINILKTRKVCTKYIISIMGS